MLSPVDPTTDQVPPLFVDLIILLEVPFVTTIQVPPLYARPDGESVPGIEVVVDHVAALSVLI